MLSPSSHLPPSSDIAELFRLAEALLQATGFLPQHLQTAGAVVAVILAGRELGIPPMSSLRSISLLKGKVIIAADQQLALMKARGARVRWVKDGTDGEAVLEVTRLGESEPQLSRYTWQMAERAGLTGQPTWQKHPASMLRARAASAAGKAIMPDVLSGCYVPGELDDIAPEPTLQRLPSGPVLVVGELDDPQEPEAPQAPAEAAQAPQGVVVPISSAQRPERPQEPQSGLEAQLGVDPKLAQDLRACASHDDLLAWYRGLLAMKVKDPGQRREIWKVFTQKAHTLKADPNVIAQVAAGGAK